jgi:MoaA/NifB/PqqE/SkfB family radical SAM enzyme
MINYADWPLSAPVNLTWEITHRCNLSCIHCLSSSQNEMPDELDFKECKAVVDQLAAVKVFEINFGGGEPLLKNYFLSLVDYIHTKGIVTCISTNGTLLTEKTVACLTASPLVHIQVSLDGATAEVNDYIRGQGTYLRILEGVELIAASKVPFSINTVVTSVNYSQLSNLKSWPVTMGRLCEYPDSGLPDGQEIPGTDLNSNRRSLKACPIGWESTLAF